MKSFLTCNVDGEKERLPVGPKLLAISFANDDETKALADTIGAAKLLDKMELANELIRRFWN